MNVEAAKRAKAKSDKARAMKKTAMKKRDAKELLTYSNAKWVENQIAKQKSLENEEAL